MVYHVQNFATSNEFTLESDSDDEEESTSDDDESTEHDDTTDSSCVGGAGDEGMRAFVFVNHLILLFLSFFFHSFFFLIDFTHPLLFTASSNTLGDQTFVLV